MKEYVLKTAKVPVDLSAYEAQLNPAQLQAVTAGPGPHLVIAGAGTRRLPLERVVGVHSFGLGQPL